MTYLGWAALLSTLLASIACGIERYLDGGIPVVTGLTFLPALMILWFQFLRSAEK